MFEAVSGMSLVSFVACMSQWSVKSVSLVVSVCGNCACLGYVLSGCLW